MRSHINRYPTPAHTYYVDAAAGSDANVGTSEHAAWQTASKVNAFAMKPGDRVLFKRGSTWQDQYLQPIYSGTPSRRIVFDAYGSGNIPIVNGSQLITGWVIDAGAVWKKIGCTISPQLGSRFWVDLTTTLIKAVNRGAMVAGSFFLDDPGNILYCWLSDGSDPNGHTTEYASQYMVFDANGKSYLSINNIDGRKSKHSAWNFRYVDGAHHIWVNNCVSWMSGLRGMDLGWSPAGLGLQHDIFLDNYIVHDALSEGIWMGDGYRLCALNCDVHDVYRDQVGGAKGYSGLGSAGVICVGVGSVDCVVKRCSIHDNPALGCALCVEMEVASPRPVRTIVDSNTIYYENQPGDSVRIEGSYTLLKNNVIVGQGNLVRVWDSADRTTLYHNTLYNSFNSNVALYVGAATNTVLRNNIFMTLAAGNRMITADATGMVGWDSDYNYFAGVQKWKWNVTDYLTLANWRIQSGGDANSIWSANPTDPVFAGFPNNLHILVASPCKNAGVSVGVAKDRDGAPRPYPATVTDIGAYEFQGV